MRSTKQLVSGLYVNTDMKCYQLFIYKKLMCPSHIHIFASIEWFIWSHLKSAGCAVVPVFTTRGQTSAAVPTFPPSTLSSWSRPCCITLPHLIIYYTSSSIIHRGTAPVIQRSQYTTITHPAYIIHRTSPHELCITNTHTCSLFGCCTLFSVKLWGNVTVLP